uniref:Uncharacterized protein n=1 Tax=Rhinolophus ferrumequinum TaxID=59479 RepID=A0A671EDM4_RHIFE
MSKNLRCVLPATPAPATQRPKTPGFMGHSPCSRLTCSYRQGGTWALTARSWCLFVL